MKFASCCAIYDFENSFLFNLLAFFKQKRIIHLYDPQTEEVAVTFEVNFDESECQHLQLWQQNSSSEKQQSNNILLTLLIFSIKLVEVHYIEVDVPGKHFRHLSPGPTVLTSGLPMEQLCLRLPVFDKRTSKIFLFSNIECFVSTDASLSNQSRQISFGKYAIMSDLGQINKLAGRYDDKLYFALPICTASSSSILLIYEDKRNSLFIVQWCKCVDSSKQIRIQWMQNFSSDMLTAVSCEDAHGFGNLACIACDQYLWLVSETGVLVKIATGISSTAPISALMTLPRREDYSSSSSSYPVTLQLVASAVNGEYYHIRVRGEVESIAESASTVAPTVCVRGTKISKLSVSPVFGHSDRNGLHYHTTFVPFCQSMHFAMYRRPFFCFVGYHASFGVQFLQLSKSTGIEELQKKLSFTSSPLDQITNISHGVTLQKEGDLLRRFVFSSSDSVSSKSVLYKACEGISLLSHYTYAVDALPDLTYFHIPSFPIPSATTKVHESLLLLSSKTNRCSSLHSLSYHSDSDSHELCTVSAAIRIDEATLGFFFVSSLHKNSLLQVTEKNIVLIKVIDNALVVDRCESFSSLFVHLDKSKKTLDLAANFTVQFYCYVNSCLYVAYRDTVLTILVVDEPHAPTSFRLLNVTRTKFAISGLAAADMFEGNLKCICMSFWDSTTMVLHIIGDKGQFQQSCTIELAEASERMNPVVRYVCFLPISVVGDNRTFDVIAASADGTIKAIRVIHGNSRTVQRINHGDVCTVAHLPGINAMSVIDISSHTTAVAEHEILPPIVLVNGIGTDYILQLSMSSTTFPLSYTCIQFTQPRSQVRRRCLNIFQRTSVFKQRVPDTGGSDEVVVVMCMWLESLEAGSSLCMGFIDLQIEMSDDSKHKLLSGSMCIEHVTTIDGIVETMSLSSDKDILSLWCLPNASNGFNGWLTIIDAVSFQIIWRRDIASYTQTSPTDVRQLKALEFFSSQRDGPSVEICYISADVCGAVAANLNVSMKSVVVTASMISHSLNNSRITSCHPIDRMEIPLQYNDAVIEPTAGVEHSFDEEVQRQKYLGAGDVRAAMLSRVVLLLILPDRRVVAVGFHSKVIEGIKLKDKLTLLAELKVEWKSSAVTALQCLLDKFAIIAVHGLGLVIVEYGDKEYLKHSLKFLFSVSLSETPVRSLACRLASSIQHEYRCEPVRNVHIVCLDSSRGTLSHIFARLPFEDCKLDPITSYPVIHEVEFQKEVYSDGIFQVIPVSDSSNKSKWDFSCITSELNVFGFANYNFTVVIINLLTLLKISSSMRRAVFLSDLQYFISEIENICVLRDRKRKLKSKEEVDEKEREDVATILSTSNKKQQVSPSTTDFHLSVKDTTRITITATAKTPSISSRDACIVWEESNISSLAGIGVSATLDHDHSAIKNHTTTGLTFEDASVSEDLAKSGKNIALDSRKLSIEDVDHILESALLFHSTSAVKTPIFKLICSDADNSNWDKESFKSCYNHIHTELLTRM